MVVVRVGGEAAERDRAAAVEAVAVGDGEARGGKEGGCMEGGGGGGGGDGGGGGLGGGGGNDGRAGEGGGYAHCRPIEHATGKNGGEGEGEEDGDGHVRLLSPPERSHRVGLMFESSVGTVPLNRFEVSVSAYRLVGRPSSKELCQRANSMKGATAR